MQLSLPDKLYGGLIGIFSFAGLECLSHSAPRLLGELFNGVSSPIEMGLVAANTFQLLMEGSVAYAAGRRAAIGSEIARLLDESAELEADADDLNAPNESILFHDTTPLVP